MKIFKLTFIASLIALLGGCATNKPYDYSEFKKSDPKSILVLPPKNLSPDVKASYSFYSHTQRPISEAGFYVFPITLVDETFKANGLNVADEIHNVELKKLRQIFGADAVLYINVKDYGTQFLIVNSASIVTAHARLIDAQSGNLLWEGKATASSEEGNNNQGGLAALLVSAVIKQIMGTALDQSHQIANMTSNRLLSPTMPNGILYGPRSTLYKKP
jgi:hypothetical protein